MRNWELEHTKPSIRQIPRVIEFLGFDPFPSPQCRSERISAVRRRLGMSQRELAVRLGVDSKTVCDWESGKHRPVQELALKLNRFLARFER